MQVLIPHFVPFLEAKVFAYTFKFKYECFKKNARILKQLVNFSKLRVGVSIGRFVRLLVCLSTEKIVIFCQSCFSCWNIIYSIWPKNFFTLVHHRGIVKIMDNSFEDAAARNRSWNRMYKVFIKKIRCFICPQDIFHFLLLLWLLLL